MPVSLGDKVIEGATLAVYSGRRVLVVEEG